MKSGTDKIRVCVWVWLFVVTTCHGKPLSDDESYIRFSDWLRKQGAEDEIKTQTHNYDDESSPDSKNFPSDLVLAQIFGTNHTEKSIGNIGDNVAPENLETEDHKSADEQLLALDQIFGYNNSTANGASISNKSSRLKNERSGQSQEKIKNGGQDYQQDPARGQHSRASNLDGMDGFGQILGNPENKPISLENLSTFISEDGMPYSTPSGTDKTKNNSIEKFFKDVFKESWEQENKPISQDVLFTNEDHLRTGTTQQDDVFRTNDQFVANFIQMTEQKKKNHQTQISPYNYRPVNARGVILNIPVYFPINDDGVIQLLPSFHPYRLRQVKPSLFPESLSRIRSCYY